MWARTQDKHKHLQSDHEPACLTSVDCARRLWVRSCSLALPSSMLSDGRSVADQYFPAVGSVRGALPPPARSALHRRGAMRSWEWRAIVTGAAAEYRPLGRSIKKSQRLNTEKNRTVVQPLHHWSVCWGKSSQLSIITVSCVRFYCPWDDLYTFIQKVNRFSVSQKSSRTKCVIKIHTLDLIFEVAIL